MSQWTLNRHVLRRQRIRVVVKVCHSLLLPPGPPALTCAVQTGANQKWVPMDPQAHCTTPLTQTCSVYTQPLVKQFSFIWFYIPIFSCGKQMKSQENVECLTESMAMSRTQWLPGSSWGKRQSSPGPGKWWQMSVCGENFNLSFLFFAIYSLRLVPYRDLPQRLANPASPASHT